MSMADKVIVMSDALIQQTGTAREIYEAPRTSFVASFIGNNNLFGGIVRSRSGSIVLVEAHGRMFYVRAPDYIAAVHVDPRGAFLRACRPDAYRRAPGTWRTGSRAPTSPPSSGARWKPMCSRSRRRSTSRSSSIAASTTACTTPASAKPSAGPPTPGVLLEQNP